MHNYQYRSNREYDDSDPFMVKCYEQTRFVYKPSFSCTKTPSTNNKFGLYSPMSNGNAYKVVWELLLLAKDGDDDIKRDSRIKMGKIAHHYPRYVGITNSSYSNGRVLTPNETGSLTVHYRIYHAVEESAWIDSSISNVDQSQELNFESDF